MNPSWALDPSWTTEIIGNNQHQRRFNDGWRVNPVWALGPPVHEELIRYRSARCIIPSSLKNVGLFCASSTFDPCLFYIFNGNGPAVGVFTTHIDDILGCGEPGVMDKLRQFLELRFGKLKVQEKQFVHVGMELAQDSSFSVTLTQTLRRNSSHWGLRHDYGRLDKNCYRRKM